MSQGFLTSAKVRMALVAAIASLGMVLGACNGDDENNGNNGNNGMTDGGADVMDDTSEDTGEETMDDTTEEETAMVQVIHASPDPAAATVDVWVEGQEEPLLDDFEFKSATPYVALPAGVSLNIGIAAADSTSYDDSIKTWEGVEFDADSENVVIAHGIVSPSGDQPALDLLVTQGKMAPSDDTSDELKVAHASPDAPTVDIVPNNSADSTIPDLEYGNAVGYLPVPNGILTADVVVSDSGARAASFQTPPLTGGKTWVVLATGFLSPPDDDSPAFGLTAVDNEGNVADLSLAARAQIIHASPAGAADPVDLYLNGEVFLEDVAFRASTGFVTVPSGVDLNWDVVPADGELSESVADATLNFNPGDTAIAAAVGGGGQGFSIVPKTDAQESAAGGSGNVDITVLHASPDAPAVDVGVAGALDAIASDLAFGNFTSGYFEADAAATTVIINDETQSTEIGQFAAPLDALDGAAITVVATGFAEPTGDQPALEVRVYDGTGGTGTALSAP
ncbi:MAG: DUF4397 domain-containing protein [Myxococcota bacterium]